MYRLIIVATDEDNESTRAAYNIMVSKKTMNEVLVTNVLTDSTTYRLSKMAMGEAPFFNSKDSILSVNPEEISFSSIGKYAGLSFVQTDVNDANKTADQFLHFNVDEDVIVYVAYEKLDKLLTSTIPSWLQAFKKEEGQIVAQYRYFDVYSKLYKKGIITLPGADAAHNGVGSNYFVIIKKQ